MERLFPYQPQGSYFLAPGITARSGPLLPSICHLTIFLSTSASSTNCLHSHRWRPPQSFPLCLPVSPIALCPGLTHTCSTPPSSIDPLRTPSQAMDRAGNHILQQNKRGFCGTATRRRLCLHAPIPKSSPFFHRGVLTHSAQCGRRSAASPQNSRLT